MQELLSKMTVGEWIMLLSMAFGFVITTRMTAQATNSAIAVLSEKFEDLKKSVDDLHADQQTQGERIVRLEEWRKHAESSGPRRRHDD